LRGSKDASSLRPKLDSRARKTLSAVVHEYLCSGDAVPSKAVTRRYGLDVSPATVRNVMSELEEVGLLRQPHTSAGRIPTEQGLRYFVDSLLEVRSLSQKEKDELRRRYSIDHLEFEDLMRETSRMLSELSHHTALVVAPRPDLNVFGHIEFLRLGREQLLAVLVTRSGMVLNRLIATDRPISQPELECIHNYLNGLLTGLTFEEVRGRVLDELARLKGQYDALVARALELSSEVLGGSRGVQVFVEGQVHLVEQAGSFDSEKMKALFRALEEKQLLLRLLDRTMQADGIQVFIGAETASPELSECSVVASGYGLGEPGGRLLGALGVIGPTRMNYSSVISIVDFTASFVSSAIARREAQEAGASRPGSGC
jgi:heat-inducible transcriptional repressor